MVTHSIAEKLYTGIRGYTSAYRVDHARCLAGSCDIIWQSQNIVDLQDKVGRTCTNLLCERRVLFAVPCEVLRMKTDENICLSKLQAI